MARTHTLPSLPAKHEEFLRWVQQHPDTAVEQLVAPYNAYEAVVRKLFAQEPTFPILQNNHLNIVPIYGADGSATVRTRARDPSTESPEHLEKYIMPLKNEDRRPNGSPAVVTSLEEFKNNFNIFSEGSLTDLDWSNVVVAGSAAVTCLLPVPEAHTGSKRALRQYYHEKVAPASDVDLFLYGLTEEQAIKKIKHIENSVKNAILHETTTFRTKNAITIVSQYPTRHVQIVLRIYKTVAEILTGFDVDCSCAAFDGKQVYASPRALASYITQKNTIDLSRRSPSYENRLSKYSRRGFEVYWPQLDRSKIDPTIFERGFSRTVGLARLLVLEQLPTASNRDSYMRQRREERGRPTKPSWMAYGGRGNYKEDWEDEVPEWLDEPEVSNYNTFTIPYGKKYYARKIERLFFNQDLLLNAEWNKPKDREVYLHRHPAFFGDVKDIIHDCCGYCPKPVTDEEKQVAEKESKTYVSGKVSFIKDDPGRQEVGSFNPITETDWTEMAYVGNTERLCQAIVDHDLEVVREWLSQESTDPNTRDYTGRTPLHLACMASTPEIVQCLVDNGARLTARLADGRTALHIAAARGIVQIVTILLNRSEFNEAEEDRKNDMRKAQSEKNKQSTSDETKQDPDEMDIDGSTDDNTSYTAGSFVKIGKGNDANATDQDVLDSDNTDEPDIYDINVVAWDSHASALHLAILNGHVDVVQELVGSWGADVLLPIKLLQEYDKSPRASILTLVLALRLPLDKAIDMSRKLLQLGASPTQADVARQTPVQYIAASSYSELLDVYIQQNQPATVKAINRLKPTGSGWSRPAVTSPLLTAIENTNVIVALKLLEHGADVDIDFSDFVNAIKNAYEVQARTTETNKEIFRQELSQPIICAIDSEMPELVLELLKRGADPNTLNCAGYAAEDRRSGRASDGAMSVLDCVRSKIRAIDGYERPKAGSPPILEIDKDYFTGLEEESYRRWYAQRKLQDARDAHEKSLKNLEDQNKRLEKERKGQELKIRVLADIRKGFEEVEAALLERGAKTWKDLFPQFYEDDGQQQSRASPLHDRKDPPLMPKFTFLLPDLTDVRQEGVLKLFDAAWHGDLETIKQLTLGRWGEDGKQAPLEIAIQDDCDLSPFSIAVFRGHLDTAKGIMEIVQAQYKKPEPKGHAKYEMTDNDSEQGSDIEDPELEPYHIYGTVVDEEFTTDDIGSAPAQAESSVAPLTVLSWCCPGKWFLDMSKTGSSEPYNLLQYAILSDDIPTLCFLLDLGQSLTAKYEPGDLYMVYYGEFGLALQHGRVRCLEELILRGGSCLPLDYFIQSTGAAKDEKPKYYQGLSIRGKRRADWAVAAYSGSAADVSLPDAPLLSAAQSGSLKSTEWFLSTAPARNYLDFMKSHGQYKKIELLTNSNTGVEKPLLSWLKQANYLVLHCAIMSKPTDESERLVEFLCRNVPECLEKYTREGHTPLALAFSMHRVTFARILVKAGANQAVRDGVGNNLLHLLLCGVMRETRGKPENIESLLGLLDSRLIGSLLVEWSVGSMTPISRWLKQATSAHINSHYYYGSSSSKFSYRQESEDLVEITRRLLEFAKPTGQKHLELLDGTGNSPVHDAVRRQLPGVLRLMLDQRPDLLLRENATGSTPMELAVEAWVEEVTYEPAELNTRFRGFTSRHGEMFHEDQNSPKRSERKVIYDLCREVAAQRPGKRKLVTLNEANEVAKRLAAAEKTGRPAKQENEHKDVEACLKTWYDSYRGFTNPRGW